VDKILKQLTTSHWVPEVPAEHSHLSRETHFPLEEQTVFGSDIPKQVLVSQASPEYPALHWHLSSPIQVPFELQTPVGVNLHLDKSHSIPTDPELH
jgi:hypothetical protein